MLVSLEWLKDYTEVNVSDEKFCDDMVMSGSNIETCEHVGGGLSNVVVGRIEKIEKHPDADKLVVCRLNVGRDEPVQIVTGATNVYEGAVVPVALHNSRIPGPLHGQPKTEGGVKITKGKLRGVESFGMLCGPQELGLDDKVAPYISKDGIWLLNDEFEIGAELSEALGLEDTVVDFEITPNRPDCLSMIGMAREAAAVFGTKLEYPETVCNHEEGNAADYIAVDIQSDLCRRYTARIVKDVVIKQSPWWIQKRLIRAGMRPINNIVDITNFVMLEYGQPIHAFDINTLAGGKVVIRTADEGDKFTTLDESERTLSEGMLMICDAEKPAAIAGVMGGLDSDIKDNTTTIVVESANFAGDSIRTTSKKLGLRTEASARFEKGIDPNLCAKAADRVVKLIELTGAGAPVAGSVDVYPQEIKAEPVHARVSRINKVLGVELTREFMVNALESLEMTVTGEGDDMYVTAPTVRQDIHIEEDIIEEVGRMYGFNKLPVTIPRGNSEAVKPDDRILRDLARDTMVAMGATEIQTYSFVSPKGVDNCRIDEDSWERCFVRIINPLGEENSVMRTILTPNMLEVLSRNYTRNIDSVKAFEIGNTFMADLFDEKALPEESYSMCVGMYGKDADFYALKGMIVELLSIMGIRDVEFVAESEYGVYHPGRCARIIARIPKKAMPEVDDLKKLLLTGEVEGTEEYNKLKDIIENNDPVAMGDYEEVELGIMGEVHPEVTAKYQIKTRCCVCELMFDTVCEISDTDKTYTPLPKYPSTSRDIALIVDEDMEVGTIEKVIKAAASEILKNVKLFDIYRGEQVADGKKSVAFTLTYQDENKTLTDDDVAPVHSNILKALEETLGAVLREM